MVVLKRAMGGDDAGTAWVGIGVQGLGRKNKAVTQRLSGGAKRCLGMNKIQRNRKTHYTFFHRQLPVLRLRWSQHVPPKHWYTSVKLHGITS